LSRQDAPRTLQTLRGEEIVMDDVDAFVATVVPRLTEEVRALHRGDVTPRKALWSHRDPVSLFGAVLTARGWDQVESAFDRLAARFSGSESCEYDVVAAGVSGDLGYVVGIEHSTAGINGEPATYALRVTTVLRREDGDWKVVHRHGDPYDRASETATDGLAAAMSTVGRVAASG
jgi:ketosteroid isomerase-like protein